ncbi:hypothetical protein K402DRAFT_394272 [Aulographum hederae CBS 113979]|uniref:Protein FYV10 n=1 Tax=Aulographum hederae CBS 113979 TaxID=1176131 RepID=A0A6G1GZ08_9PEZI|nr:hypothetical protein K402DRAFT_394272 [Aulographum hederae CBS 113979]
MAEFHAAALNPNSHLILDQSLLRLPTEILKKNNKTAQTLVSVEQHHVLKSLSSAAKVCVETPDASTAQAAALSALDTNIANLTLLKSKLSALQSSNANVHSSTHARLTHLAELQNIPSLADVKYDEWSRVRLDRLLVDYLLRQGYIESARQLATSKSILPLVSVEIDAFEACGRIEKSLRSGRLTEALVWCSDNKKELRKLNSCLEGELRFQQYIELVRSGEWRKLGEATVYARKHLAGGNDAEFAIRAAGLLAFTSDTSAEPYRALYSSDRYTTLATLFLQTYQTLYSLPEVPLLSTTLSAGLSALKTPACHSNTTPSIGSNPGASAHNPSQHPQNPHRNRTTHSNNPNVFTPSATATASVNPSSSSTTGPPASTTSASLLLTHSLCPICSTELNELARGVPRAHHLKSHVDADLVVLPNGRVYGRRRLEEANRALVGSGGEEEGSGGGGRDGNGGAEGDGWVRDPMDLGRRWKWSEVKKVYIS